MNRGDADAEGRHDALDRWLAAIEPFVSWSTAEWGRRDLCAALAARVASVRGSGDELAALFERAARDATGEAEVRTALLVDPTPAEIDEAIGKADARIEPGGALLALFREGCSDGEPVRAADAARSFADRARRTTAFRAAIPRTLGGAWLVVARRTSPRPRIALLPDGPGACLQIRTLGPLEELEARGDCELRLLGRDSSAIDLADIDLLLLQRYGGPLAARLRAAARRMGVPVALELDDDFFNLPWYNPGARGFAAFDTRVLLESLLRGADAIVTSTPYLRERMLGYNERVLTLHNLVDTTLFVERDSPFAEPGTTVFGYIGTKTHAEDFRPVLGPLRELILGGGGRVRATFIGHVPDELRRLPGVRYLGWFDTYHNAAAALSRSGANVALAPLIDLEFNRSKSAMKYLEYGACGIPGIFSDVEAYRGFVRHGDNGLLVPRHRAEDWAAAMRRMIEAPGERERMGRAALEDATTGHSVARRAGDLLSLYRDVIDEGPRDRPTHSPRPFAGQGAAPAALVRLDGGVEEAAATLATIRAALPDGTRMIVTASDPDTRETLEPVTELTVLEPDDDGRCGAIAHALTLDGVERLLVLDGRIVLSPGAVERLLGAAAADVAAIGPRVLAPSSEQSVRAILDTVPAGHPGLDDALRDRARREPVSEAAWLDGTCVLLRAEAVRLAGGLDATMTWDDALVDLCRRLTARRQRVLVLNRVYAGLRSDLTPRPIAARVRRDSRDRLGRALAGDGTRVALEHLRDPARLFGGREGERLDVWVRARPASAYLAECLRRIALHVDLPHTLRVLGEPGDGIVVAATAAHDATLETAPAAEHAATLRRWIADAPASHALLLHDGVALTPESAREMLNTMLRWRPTAVAPFSNDGAPEQRLVIDRAPALETLDAMAAACLAGRDDGGHAVEACSPACVLLDLRAARSLDDGAAPRLERLTRSGAGVRLARATRAYAHVLAHPSDSPELPFVPWPGGPLDHGFVPAPDAGEAADDLAAFVGRVRPLLDALRRNPGDARLLAGLGLLYLSRREIDSGMSFLDRARKVDPYDPSVVEAMAHARRVLDSVAAS